MIRLKTSIGFIVASLICFSIACGKKNSQGLAIAANPSQPILIPTSSANSSIAAPYIFINSLTITWSGSNKFEPLALNLYASSTTGNSSNSKTSFNCAADGSFLNAIFFFSSITDNPSGCSGYSGKIPVQDLQQLVLPGIQTAGCTMSITSTGFYCESLPITVSTNPWATYNVPVQVILFGEGLDNIGYNTQGNITGRINAVTNITIQ